MSEVIKVNITCSFEEEVYEYTLKINNWPYVQSMAGLVNEQKFEAQTGLQSNNKIKSTWIIGIKAVCRNNEGEWNWLETPDHIRDDRATAKLIVPYCQLTQLNGNMTEVPIKFGCLMKSSQNNDKAMLEYMQTVHLQHEIRLGHVCPLLDGMLARYTITDATFVFRLTLLVPKIQQSSRPSFVNIEDFQLKCFEQNRKQHAKLLRNVSSSDLKIITSDKKAICAHKVIINTQCPSFAVIYGSKYIDGIVHADDIAGKTMKIILHYLYTGELLPTWSDSDTLVDFTNAAGKFKLQEILGMLNSVLGTTAVNETPETNIKLLKLAQKYEMRNAEEALMQRVTNLVVRQKTCSELLEFLENKPDPDPHNMTTN